IPRIQRLYMTEESAKQMTWHKKGVRYNPEKMVHPSDGESCPIVMGFIVRKLKKLVMYVLRWKQMGSILIDGGRIVLMLTRLCYTSESSPPGVLFQRQIIFVLLIIPDHPENK